MCWREFEIEKILQCLLIPSQNNFFSHFNWKLLMVITDSSKLKGNKKHKITSSHILFSSFSCYIKLDYEENLKRKKNQSSSHNIDWINHKKNEKKVISKESWMKKDSLVIQICRFNKIVLKLCFSFQTHLENIADSFFSIVGNGRNSHIDILIICYKGRMHNFQVLLLI